MSHHKRELLLQYLQSNYDHLLKINTSHHHDSQEASSPPSLQTTAETQASLSEVPPSTHNHPSTPSPTIKIPRAHLKHLVQRTQWRTSKIIAFIDYHFDSMRHPEPLSEQQKAHIHNYFATLPPTDREQHPSPENTPPLTLAAHLHYLASSLKVSKARLRYYVARHFPSAAQQSTRKPTTTLTKSATERMRSLLRTHNIATCDQWTNLTRSARHPILTEMHQVHGLTTKQLHYLAYKILRPALTHRLQQRIIQHLAEQGLIPSSSLPSDSSSVSTHNASSTKSVTILKILTHQFSLSPRQACYLYSKLKRKGIFSSHRTTKLQPRWTAQKRHIVLQHLDSVSQPHSERDTPDYQYLEQHTGMSRRQIYVFIHRTQQYNKYGSVTREKKEKLVSDYQHWKDELRRNDSDSTDTSSSSLLNVESYLQHVRQNLSTNQLLEDYYQMNIAQIHTILSSVDRGILSTEVKESVRLWLEQHDWRSPDHSEFQALLSKTKLSKKQLFNLISSLKDPPGKLTLQNKLLVKEYLHKMESSSQGDGKRIALCRQDVDQLKLDTGLSRQQIHELCRWYNENMKSQQSESFVSDAQKMKLREWVQQHGTERPITKEDREALLRDVNMKRSQLNYYLRKYSKEMKKK